MEWWRVGEVAVATSAAILLLRRRSTRQRCSEVNAERHLAQTRAATNEATLRTLGYKNSHNGGSPDVKSLDARVVDAIKKAFAQAQSVTGGHVYDSQDVKGLSDSDPSLFAVSIVSVSGNQLSLGASSTKFLTQSTFKPLVFAFALKTLGTTQVSNAVADTGCKGYRAVTIEADGRAHNPLINSGALSVMQLLSQAGYAVADVVKFVQSLVATTTAAATTATTAATAATTAAAAAAAACTTTTGTVTDITVNQSAYKATLADSAHNLAFCRSLGQHDFFPDSEAAAAAAVDWYSQLDCMQTTTDSFARVAARYVLSEVA
jgi:glutaminase